MSKVGDKVEEDVKGAGEEKEMGEIGAAAIAASSLF